MKPFQNFDLDTSVQPTVLRVRARGRDVLRSPVTNWGTAYTLTQREALGLSGLLPNRVTTLEEQARRMYVQYGRASGLLAKFVELSQLRDRNEVLFYRLLLDHLEEMLPIVYTPTIGEAIEHFSEEYHGTRAVFLSIDHPELIEESLRDFGLDAEDVDLVVATDSEGILGIGDQGVGGVQIAIGKLAVYTAAAGIHPHRAIPVVLDVGTDNVGLLSSDWYLGERHARVRGERYDEFIDTLVQTVSSLFPNAMLHWEDFGASNAHRILDRYSDKMCTFNDDIQGTAAVVLAALLSAVRLSGLPLTEHRVVVYGAGTAGIGIADIVVDAMTRAGLQPDEARRRFYAFGRHGLIVEDTPGIRDFQQPYARPRAEVGRWETVDPTSVTLAETVRATKPTILIGTSADRGAFTEDVVRAMGTTCQRPIILPLSNPTSRSEAHPADLLAWTDGRALIATGSPYGTVQYDDVAHTIAQANNALIFPGLGLGVSAVRADRVTDEMIFRAAEALAGLVHDHRPGASLLPSINDLRLASAAVAVAVATCAIEEGHARHPLANPVDEIYRRMWKPEYPQLEVINQQADPAMA